MIYRIEGNYYTLIDNEDSITSNNIRLIRIYGFISRKKRNLVGNDIFVTYIDIDHKYAYTCADYNKLMKLLRIDRIKDILK